jgi:uncharacterized membrane protein
MGPYGAPAYPPGMGGEPKTSGLAIAGFICAFVCNLVGLILSIVALSKINSSGGQLKGKGLAIAGIILSAIFLVISILFQIAALSH